MALATPNGFQIGQQITEIRGSQLVPLGLKHPVRSKFRNKLVFSLSATAACLWTHSKLTAAVELEFSLNMEGALYDGIVSKYAAIKTNPYKKHIEEPTVWACIGDIKGQTVLDLACGNGYYSREMRKRDAKLVLGLDISGSQIEEARNLGDPGMKFC